MRQLNLIIALINPTYERHGERNRPEPAIEEEEAGLWVDTEEASDVDVVGKSGRQPKDADNNLRRLNLQQSHSQGI